MDDTLSARIQQDLRTCHLSYNETTGILSIQRSTGQQFVSRLKRLHCPSQEQLLQFACKALYDAIDSAYAFECYHSEGNDFTFLDSFAAWCEHTDVLGAGKISVREALKQWRELRQLWNELEDFLTKDHLLVYLKLYTELYAKEGEM